MPDPLDTLRNDLLRSLWIADDGPHWAVANIANPDKAMADRIESLYGKTVDCLMAALAAASGEQRRALLGILGYEAREGWLVREHDLACDITWERVQWVRSGVENAEPCLVLRDQRETTE